MAAYTAVVSLMHDLEQRLAFYDHTYGSLSELWFWPFTKKETEILRNTVSSMDILLEDLSGQSYDHESMVQLWEKKWIWDKLYAYFPGGSSVERWFCPFTKKEIEILRNTDCSMVQMFTPYDDTFGRSSEQAVCPFTKKEMEILYKTLSSMESLLRDSSGQSYHHELMNLMLEKRILDLACDAGCYLDFWAAHCVKVRESTRQTVIRACLRKTIEQIRSINDQLSISEAGKYNFMGIKEAVGELKQHLGNYFSYSKYKNFSFAWGDIIYLRGTILFTDSYIKSTKSLMSSSDGHDFITQISEERILEVVHNAGRFVDFLFNTLGRLELCLPNKNDVHTGKGFFRIS